MHSSCGRELTPLARVTMMNHVPLLNFRWEGPSETTTSSCSYLDKPSCVFVGNSPPRRVSPAAAMDKTIKQSTDLYSSHGEVLRQFPLEVVREALVLGILPQSCRNDSYRVISPSHSRARCANRK